MKKALLKKLLLFGEIIFGLSLVLVVVVSVFPLIPPFRNYYHSRTVLTGSMEPKIPQGAVIINQWADQKNLKVGDVITFRKPDSQSPVYVTHRIKSINTAKPLFVFETKGDANPVVDMWRVTPAVVEGKVIFVIPFLGYPIEFFRTLLGFIIFVALPIILYISNQILGLWKMRKKGNLVVLFLPIIMIGLLPIKPTLAFFSSSSVIISGINLQTATDFTVPTSALTVSNSPPKKVENKIINGNFSNGLIGWTTAGDVTVSGGIAKIGSDSSDPNYVGNYVWENRLMQSFQAGVKNLGLDYNFFTNDYGSFDDPGFLIRLNDKQIFATDAASVTNSSGWQHFDYDLSGYPDTTILNLAIYAGNTGGTDYQSWAYVTNVTTNTVTASSSATYNVTGTTNCFYNTGSGWLPATNFHLGPTDGSYNLNYKCVSDSGVPSLEKAVPVKVDSVAPTTITDLETTVISTNSAILTWTAPNGASSYDLRYSTATISAENFSSATKYSGINAAKGNGEPESVEVLGLNPNTLYYFAIKSADAAPNWSDMSNVVSVTTPAGATVNEGDIVINELMWMGTGAGANDEYLELRNMTGRTISLSNFSLEKYDGTDMGIDFSGKSIAPNGYFLITNFATGSASSHLKSGVVSNLVDSSLTLNNSNLGLKLLANGIQIDTAGNGSTPLSGIYDGTSDVKKYYSMERTTVPGDGANALSWYTCIDPASTGDFFTGSFERGTPGAPNRSENAPINISPSISMSKSDKTVSFNVENITGFTQISYELTYDTDSVPQGVFGKGSSAVITLGTCSTGGTCVYHTGVKNIHFKVTLVDKENKEVLLEKDL